MMEKSEYIEKWKVVNMLIDVENRAQGTYRENGEKLYRDLVETEIKIGKLPAADVAPVVRCKDCKHKGWLQEPCHGKSVDFCNVWDSCINSPDKCFCYYGEAKPSIQWEAD